MAVKYHSDNFFQSGAERISILEHYAGDFPRVVYRANGVEKPDDDDGAQAYERNLVRGRSVDTHVVANKADLEAALADGWFMTPEETDQDIASDPVAEAEVRRGPGRPRKIEE